MKALEKNGTWKIIERQEGKKSVGWKLINSVKYKLDVTLDYYKAWLVEKVILKHMT